MKKTNLILVVALAITSSFAFAQNEPPADNSMADDILGDLPPESPGEAAPKTPPAAQAPATNAEPVQIGTPEAPIDLTPAKNDAFDRLDALKMTRQELVAFMKSGGLKSRLMKEQK